MAERGFYVAQLGLEGMNVFLVGLMFAPDNIKGVFPQGIEIIIEGIAGQLSAQFRAAIVVALILLFCFLAFASIFPEVYRVVTTEMGQSTPAE